MRSAGDIWLSALGELQIQVTKPNFQTWLKDTVGLSFDHGRFVVGVPTVFVAEWLEKRWRSMIKKTLMGITGQELEVQFVVHPSSQDSSSPTPPATTDPAPSSDGRWPYPAPRLNPKYTFESFIVGSCNRLAHAAALGVAENPGGNYNPLFIYGGVGLGKTHLLHAIGHVALAKHLQLLYVSAEQFTNEFISSIQQRKTEDFRAKYRSADMLLMDDIHFISGKEQTQEGFFHTFNDLHNSNRQIVITSDRPPKSMPLLEDRLRSRFEWGLIADIQPPDWETRLAILRAKAEQQTVIIDEAVLELIARRVQQNIRELEGCLNRVVAYSQLTHTIPTPELAAQVLEDIVAKQRRSTITPGLILEKVAEYFRLSSAALKGKRRDQPTALARQIAMYLIREETSIPLAEIGQELGGRDHSTVLHGCEKIAAEINTNPGLRRDVLEIRAMLYPREERL
ncbi:MAG TPA: chromosomal replication initiator protein DnaA [Dehalococcoidia bacterium]|nr:chromosomal replication initiator protein DnaA [Dehalococcoidia bacterium]